MTSKEKIKYRQTKEWKSFRKKMIDKQDYTCEMCNTKYYGKRRKMLNVHHKDEENYTDLNPKKFKILCSNDHELYHNMIKKIENNKLSVNLLYAWANLFVQVGLISNNLLKKLKKSKNAYCSFTIHDRNDKNNLIKHKDKTYIKINKLK